jgi:hypothetical protein
VSGPASDPPRIGDIGRALAAGIGNRELWAIGIAVVVAPLLSILLAMAIALLTPWGDAWSTWPARWLSLSDFAFGVLIVVVWQAASVLLVPSSLRGPMEVQTWAGERELGAWQRATGSLPWQLPPTTPAAAERWLARHPETAMNRGPRAEVLLVARRFDEARATLARIPVATVGDRIARADLVATTTFVERGELELGELRAAAAAAEGEDRLDGVVRIAMLEVRAAIATGGDWVTPLAAARVELGPRADGVLWSGFFVRRLLLLAPLILVASVAFGLVRALGGP